MLITKENGSGVISKIGRILTDDYGVKLIDVQRAQIRLYNTPNLRGLGIEFVTSVRGKVHNKTVWTDSDEAEYFREAVAELGAWLVLVKEIGRGPDKSTE